MKVIAALVVLLVLMFAQFTQQEIIKSNNFQTRVSLPINQEAEKDVGYLLRPRPVAK